MNNRDHDGKSKTASAVDQEHYPEQHEVDGAGFEEGDSLPTRHQIAERAYQLWRAHGCPAGTADRDWQDAEEELRSAITSKTVLASTARKQGSVQE